MILRKKHHIASWIMIALISVVACKNTPAETATPPAAAATTTNSNEAVPAPAAAPTTTTAAATTPTTADATQIQWISPEQLEAAAQKEPRKVLVDLYTDWCGWCKKLDKQTFSHPHIGNYVNQKFYAVKMNAENPNDITFKGQTYHFRPAGGGGGHGGVVWGGGGRGPPTVAFLDENYNASMLLRVFVCQRNSMPCSNTSAKIIIKNNLLTLFPPVLNRKFRSCLGFFFDQFANKNSNKSN
ncbi:MAG: thioredoxin family protein [Sphingobacteriales bacterium]|nr:thioredoxin family protein [Sphingobacteriales bacterium]